MSHPILLSRGDGRVIVVDLPTSISWAQDTCHRLKSVEAVATPFNTPEPKGEKLTHLRAAIPRSELDYQQDIESTIDEALKEARQHLPSAPYATWHLPRMIATDASLANNYEPRDSKASIASQPPLVLSPQVNNIENIDTIRNVVVHNPHSEAIDLLTDNVGRFFVPTGSTFLMSTIGQGSEAFTKATHTLSSGPYSPGEAHITFDIIIMDPPWGNRSVRNSHAYSSADDQETDPFWQTIPIVRDFRAAKGYVAVWITNKAKVRRQVSKAFAELNLQLVEEWIWIKITSKGDPVMPLNGLWRKPYEILLLFGNNFPTASINKRVLIATPDIHSRKPNLKFMFDDMFPPQYRALELFARNLTSNWWSWGAEVLKFQRQDCWLPVLV